MKKTLALTFAALLFAACTNNEKQLHQRAEELCRYIPDHELLEQSKDYMTADFYAVLDTMFHLPEHEAMDHEWLYYFVTGNGGTMANYEVVQVEQTDETHALAIILVRQMWEDGSFDEENDIEEHRLYMECVNGTVCRWMGKLTTLNMDKYHILSQRNWNCDIGPARSELGFDPQWPLERGVLETVAWYKQEGWL